jgi:chromosome segregation ATPase
MMYASGKHTDEAVQPARRQGGWLLVFVLALAASNGLLLWKLRVQRQECLGEITALRESIAAEIAGLRTAAHAASNAARQTEQSMRQELEEAERRAASAAGQARTQAVRHAEQLARRLAAEQNKQRQELAGELDGLKSATSAAQARFTEVSREVHSVRSEIGGAFADLKGVRGDLGYQGGLIATNARELAALKARGERRYFEFRLLKGKEAQAVGNIRLTLQKTDPRNNRFTLTVLADDKTIEKRDRTINEPVQFYVLGARQPYEIVVNEVQKDRVIGYLATPKAVEIASR